MRQVGNPKRPRFVTATELAEYVARLQDPGRAARPDATTSQRREHGRARHARHDANVKRYQRP